MFLEDSLPVCVMSCSCRELEEMFLLAALDLSAEFKVFVSSGIPVVNVATSSTQPGYLEPASVARPEEKEGREVEEATVD